MLKFTGFETPTPCEGLNTSTATLPTSAISAALICAVRWVLSTILVGRLAPFQRRTAPVAKFAPTTEIEKPAAPALTPFGESELITGCKDLEGSGTRMSHIL